MDTFYTVVGFILFAGVVIYFCYRKETVYDSQRGLLFRKGILRKVLPPGQYWIFHPYCVVNKVDVRLRTVTVPSQEVLSSDNVTLKVSLAVQYWVSDPVIAITQIEMYQDALYMHLQIALRDFVGELKIDEVIAKRKEIAKTLFEKAEPKAKELGLSLKLVDVKDVMFQGDLKKAFVQIIKAQKEGQAILEKARGETAALRNLANAAKLLEGNPALMQLRVLQSLDAGKGNTMVIGLPQDMMLVSSKKHSNTAETSQSQEQ